MVTIYRAVPALLDLWALVVRDCSAAGARAGSSEGDGTWVLLDSVRRAGSISLAVVGSFSELSNSAIAREIEARRGIRERREIGREII